MKQITFLIACLLFQLSVGQVTFVIDELPEGHDFEQSIYISGDFEDWSGGKEDFRLNKDSQKYSITIPEEYCKLLFKFTLGSWATVETTADGSATDNRTYDCKQGEKTVKIAIRGWTVPGSSKPVKSTARENVQILSEEFKMPQLDRKRRIWIYLPADYESSDERYPVLYMHDGQNLFDVATSYAGEWHVDEIMDRITANTGFKAIVVGIDNGQEFRFNEYSPYEHPRIDKPEGEDYVNFLVKTLKPYIDENFRTKSDSDNTGIMGSSMGGLISHYAALSYPGVFGKIGVFSPSFWISEKAFEFAEAQSELDNMRMYFLMGDREGEDAVPNMDKMISTMSGSGFLGDIKRKVVKGGQHNEKLWRDNFEEAMLWLFEIDQPVLGNAYRIYESIKATDHGVEIKVNDGLYQIQYYSPEIVETTFIPEGQEFKDESHAVVLNTKSSSDRIADGDEGVIVYSDGIDLIINKNPFQIAYSYKDQIILSEKKGYHKTDYGEAIQFNVSQTEVLYGGGERALGMNRRGNKLQLYNKAHYGYEYRSPLMNFSMPIVMSSEGYLVHFDNAPIGYLDLDSQMDNTITYETISGRKTYQVVVGDDWYDLIDNYTDLTGKQPIPPQWAFGNFASRFGYHSEAETRMTIDKFREEKIPVDAVILDIYWFGKDIQGHMGNMRFLRDSFPNPEKMIGDFEKANVKTILISEPFILTTSERWEEAVENKALAVDSTGNPFTFDFYFGNTGIVDVYSESGKTWFWNIYKEIAEMGVAGVWGDLGEPEAHPSEAIHATGTADEVHNTYGHDWARLVYEGYRKDFPDQRPFILMRAGYSGSQHYGLIPWSGDVSRSWGGFNPQIEIALQMGMQGMGYFHSDLGGFAGGNLDDELYTRWLQYGVFQPIFRPHAQEVVPSEPVFRAPKAKALAKKSIELRYRMLPYNYTLAFENSQTGAPFMRPLFFSEPENQDLWTDSDTFLWGSDFLVSPVVEQGQKEKSVYFPKGSAWFDFYSGQRIEGGQSRTVRTNEEFIPTYVRAGAFIPFAKLVQSTAEYDRDYIELHYYHDNDIFASSGKQYIDDGKTPEAYSNGIYEILTYESRLKGKKLNFRFNREHGNAYFPMDKLVELIVYRINNKPRQVRVNGGKVSYEYQERSNTLIIPVEWPRDEATKVTIKFK